jgi:membrane fusion protein, protease secretion system
MANLSLIKRSNELAHPATDIVAPRESALAPLSTDTGRAGRIGMWALALGFGGFLLWASFAPLDEGVAASGTVAIDTHRKSVQHLTGGIVKEVLVREGDVVKEGQVVMKLDQAVARANFEAERQRYLSLRATQSRLIAEQTGARTIQWHPDLVAAKDDPIIRAQMSTQEQLMNARRGGLAADLQSLNENIQGQEGLIVSYQGMLENRRNQLSLVDEELKNTRGLVSDGYAPRNRQLELERMTADSKASLAELQGNIVRARQAISEMRQRGISLRQQYSKETESLMADVGRDVQGESEKVIALKNDLARTEIRSPAEGQVVGLAMQTPGGVIQAGQKLMDIVPKDEPLLLEAKVPPHVIDRVHAGLPVDIRFSSFAHSPTLVVDGKVLSVSGDLITEPQGNSAVSYYLARVSVTPEGVKQLGHRTMQPGMPVEVIFRTGERTLLKYLIGPLTKRMAASMKEE